MSIHIFASQQSTSFSRNHKSISLFSMRSNRRTSPKHSTCFSLKKRCDFTNFYTKKKSFEAQTPLIVLKTTVRYLHYSLKEGVAKWKTKNILFWVFFTDTIFFEIGRNMHDRISILHKMYFFAKKKMHVCTFQCEWVFDKGHWAM